jgi:mannose-1-phosphate guanylyltransferase
VNEGSDQKIVPVILSGGSGTRLWPLSRTRRPKQLLPLFGDKSLLEATLERVKDPDLFAEPIIVAGEAQAEAIGEILRGRGELIVEPCARNTAPAIALAAMNAPQDALILVMPSDHLIADVDAFSEAVRRGRGAAQDGYIVAFGMKPDRPETGFGYITRAEPIEEGVWTVEQFVEKPDKATAESFVAGGRHDWNGGIFLMRAGRYLDALKMHAPAIFEAVRRSVDGQSRLEGRSSPDRGAFERCPSQSIDYAVMEKEKRIAVVPARLGWSDVGSFETLHAASAKDDADNVVHGDVIAIDCLGSFIRSEAIAVAAVGVEDLVIVATTDALLVVPRKRSQEVKRIVDALAERERLNLL